MFGIAGQFFAEVRIDGKELPLQLGGFEHILIVQNTAINVPQFRIAIYDDSNMLNSVRTIVEGTPISILIGRSEQDAEPPTEFKFRSFGAPRRQDNGRAMYVIAGFLDAMKYLRGQPVGGMRGTSQAVIAKLAEDCGLQFRGDSTNDEMTWMLARKAYCSTAQYVCSHGWVDQQSCMGLGLDERGVLHYRNLSRLVTSKPEVTLWLGDPPNDGTRGAHIDTIDVKSTSGLQNSLFGYGTVAIQEGIGGIAQTFDKVKATLLSNTLEMNREVRDSVGRVRSEYVPPDCGNTHASFRAAEHQNRRIRMTFATKLDVLTGQNANLTLLDLVRLRLAPSADPNMARSYNGNYIVTAKARYIGRNSYMEKYRLLTQGRQVDSTGDLIA